MMPTTKKKSKRAYLYIFSTCHHAYVLLNEGQHSIKKYITTTSKNVNVIN